MLTDRKLEEAILGLLESNIYKTTAQVAAELRMEHPKIWQELEREGEALFGNSCTSFQQPYTRISQLLLSMPSSVCLRRRINNEYQWSKPS